MKVVRKSKRLSIYKKMLEWYETPESEDHMHYGFCYIMQAVAPSDEKNDNGFVNESSDYQFYAPYNHVKYPELLKYKPKHVIGYQYWFYVNEKGIAQRRQILRTIIKEMSI